MTINYRLILLIMLSSALLISCSSNDAKKTSTGKKSRYQMTNDRYPDDAPDVSLVKNAQPKYEP